MGMVVRFNTLLVNPYYQSVDFIAYIVLVLSSSSWVNHALYMEVVCITMILDVISVTEI
uniref:Uncharacterized protein n=1 Tax=Arundo donax TaxID=35708 RepID=A0A0A9G5I0_ARUDO